MSMGSRGMGGGGGGGNGERPKENGFHHQSMMSTHHNGMMDSHGSQAGPSANGFYSSIASGGKNYPPIPPAHNGIHNDRSLMNGANGGMPLTHNLNGMINGMSTGLSIAKPEMCYFCFDVLYCHLFRLDPPRVPSFTNDM